MANQSIIVGGKEIQLVAPKADLTPATRQPGGKYEPTTPAAIRRQYPLDVLVEADLQPWRAAVQFSFPTFLGFGEHNGHKTVIVNFPNGISYGAMYLQFGATQRVTQMVMKRSTAGYNEGLGVDNFGDPLYNTNANGLYTAANTWVTRNLSVIRAKQMFGVGLNGNNSAVLEFYFIDDMSPI